MLTAGGRYHAGGGVSGQEYDNFAAVDSYETGEYINKTSDMEPGRRNGHHKYEVIISVSMCVNVLLSLGIRALTTYNFASLFSFKSGHINHHMSLGSIRFVENYVSLM